MFKTVTAALIAVAASATIAAANTSYITNTPAQFDRGADVELGLVVSQGAGVVELYAYSGSEIGTLLDVEAIDAGANIDVEFDVQSIILGNAIALLKVDGEVVDSQVINLR